MVKKYRKKRTLTPEQKKAAADRLAAAREKRLAKNGGVEKSLHPSLRDLSDDDPFHPTKVKEWIKYNKEKLSALKSRVKSKEPRALSDYEQCRAYILNMESYLKNGIWLDLFYGPDQNFIVTWKCSHVGYDSKGEVKRSPNTLYDQNTKY